MKRSEELTLSWMTDWSRSSPLWCLLALGLCSCKPGAPLGPSPAACRSKGCIWIEHKQERLVECQQIDFDWVVEAAECMGPHIEYFGTPTCVDTRAWLSRVASQK